MGRSNSAKNIDLNQKSTFSSICITTNASNAGGTDVGDRPKRSRSNAKSAIVRDRVPRFDDLRQLGLAGPNRCASAARLSPLRRATPRKLCDRPNAKTTGRGRPDWAMSWASCAARLPSPQFSRSGPGERIGLGEVIGPAGCSIKPSKRSSSAGETAHVVRHCYGASRDARGGGNLIRVIVRQLGRKGVYLWGNSWSFGQRQLPWRVTSSMVLRCAVSAAM